MAEDQLSGLDMDEEIVQEMKPLRISGSPSVRQRISELILGQENEAILCAFDKRCSAAQPGQAVMDYARALFHALGPLAREDEACKAAQLLLLVLLRVLHLVHSQRLVVDKKVQDCIAFLAQQMDVLPRKALPRVSESILLHLQSLGETGTGQACSGEEGRTLELLPRCLSLILASIDPVVTSNEDGEDAEERTISGRAYVAEVVELFAAFPWPTVLLMRIVTMVRELPVDAVQMEKLLRKVFHHLKDSEPQELPALVYQLLLIASKGFRRVVLVGLVTFFDRMAKTRKACGATGGRNKHLAELHRQTEGTVVLHINFAVKQDPALGKEWLNLARSGQSLTPFTVSVLLSISRIPRFEQPSYDLLKAAALKAYQDMQHCRESAWASSTLGLRCTRTENMLRQAFMRTVQNNTFGWDHIIPSVVHMGFLLVESGPGGRISVLNEGRTIDPAASGSQAFGVEVLTAAFEAHSMARDEIIEQSKCRIIGLKSENSAPIIRMLAQLVKTYPQLMLENAARLKECLDYFTFLHSASASSLVRAISPLFQLSQDLQDYTVLVLRKAMFSRDAGARMTAVQGILDLIIAEKHSTLLRGPDSLMHTTSEASCSQSFSQRDRISDFGRGASLLHELLGLLRRSLTQQAIVRETMYGGLPKLMLVDPGAADAVFDFVWPHFRRYCEFHEMGATLKLTLCVKTKDGIVQLEEPLHHLVSCVYQLLTLQSLGGQGQDSVYDFGFTLTPEPEGGRGSSGEALAAAFSNFRQSLQSKSLGDFKLDTTQNFSADTTEGGSNLEQARVLLGILEVLMGVAIRDLAKKHVEAEKELMSYLTLHDSLEQVLSQRQGKAPKKGAKPLKNRERPSVSGKQAPFAVPRECIEKRKPLLDSACIAHLLQLVTDKLSQCGNGSQQGSPSASTFDSRLAFFALRSCLSHLNAASREASDQSELLSKLRDLIGSDWKILARPLCDLLVALKTCGMAHASQEGAKDTSKTGKGRKQVTNEIGGDLTLAALKCLDELIRLSHQRNCVTAIFRAFSVVSGKGLHDGDDEDDGEQAKLVDQWLVKQSQPLMVEFLSQSRWEETEILASLICFLASKLPPSTMEVHGAWAEMLCQQHKVPSAGAARALATMAICLHPPPNDLDIGQKIAQELQFVMGAADMDAIHSSTVYPVLSLPTRTGIGGLLLQHVETCLTDIEWVVAKLKIEPSGKASEVSGRAECTILGPDLARSKQEEMVHARMEALVLLVARFAAMSLPGSLAEQLLKTAIKLYKCLVATTRLGIAPKGYLQASPSPKFQRLADVTCKSLTIPIYTFVAAMQSDQQENLQGKVYVNHIKREAKTIPNLIFQVEEYEKYLIQLSNLTKINLMRHAKRSTARDFKILDSKKQPKEPRNVEPQEPPHPDAGTDQDSDNDEELADADLVAEADDEDGEEINEDDDVQVQAEDCLPNGHAEDEDLDEETAVQSPLGINVRLSGTQGHPSGARSSKRARRTS